MEETKVTIDLKWYTELVDAYARRCAVERMVQAGGYVSTGDIIAVLGCKTKKEEKTNETV